MFVFLGICLVSAVFCLRRLLNGMGLSVGLKVLWLVLTCK